MGRNLPFQSPPPALLQRCGVQQQYSSRHYSTTAVGRNISRMLDMGGAPSGSTSSKKNIRVQNTSKNSKVQAVAFDFELLVHAIEEQEDIAISSLVEEDSAAILDASSASSSEKLATSASIKPNVDQVQEVANLLRPPTSDTGEDDDLSALLGGGKTAANKEPELYRAPQAPPQAPPKAKNDTSDKSGIPKSLQDIRSKYGNKLHKAGVQGGIAGVDLASYQREESQKRGDAEGFLMARKMAMTSPVANTGAAGQGNTRWMALTGTGKLLSTLTYRSMKIALLPRASTNKSGTNNGKTPNERMDDLTRQLKDVVFDVLVDLPANASASNSNEQAAAVVNTMVETARKGLDLHTNLILFVSDQDVYLRAAKDLGMITCRVRPLSARRGNVSTHFTVESISQVEEVVNEMNGISYSAVLNM